MIKAVLIILCVLLLIGMISLDMYISKDLKGGSKHGSDTDKEKKN